MPTSPLRCPFFRLPREVRMPTFLQLLSRNAGFAGLRGRVQKVWEEVGHRGQGMLQNRTLFDRSWE